MKRKGIKILSIILTLAMFLTAVPVTGLTGLIKASAEYNYIQFGNYPQSKVTEENLIDTLNVMAGPTDDWTSYGYYSGTGNHTDGQMTAKDYMCYTDIIYGGAKFRGVFFDLYRPYYTGETCSNLNSNQDENGYDTGVIYWFRYEPLTWRVLDSTTGLILCENIIDSQTYNNYDLYLNSEDYGNESKTFYANNYYYSSIRQWLNNDFYNTAFNKTQKSNIEITELDNSCFTSSYPQYNAQSSNDKIFLLSYNDIKNESYGFDPSLSAEDNARIAQGTDYAKCQGLVAFPFPNFYYFGNSSWWLRSPSNVSAGACKVEESGTSTSDGGVYRTDYGIRPVCRLSELKFDISLFDDTDAYPEEFYWDKAGEAAENGYKAFDVKFGDPLEIPENPKREGYTFLGWKDWNTDEFVTLADETMDNTDGRKFYAAWQKNNYTLTYITDGEVWQTETYAFGDTIHLLTAPEKTGYSFSEWQWSEPETETMPSHDLTVTAVYKGNTYMARFYVDGELLAEIPNIYHESFIVPRSPEKAGYTFAGWSPSVPKSTPAHDTEFNAQFTPNQYIASLYVDGKLYKEIPYIYGQKSITLPSVPEKTGFVGAWESYTLSVGGTRINAVYTYIQRLHNVIAADMTVNYKSSSQLDIKVAADSGVKYTVTYESSNPKVATVDKDGKVYGAKKGTAEITVTVTDENGNKVTDTCKVTVKYSFIQWIIKIVLFGWLWY